MFHLSERARTADGWTPALVHIAALWLLAWAFRPAADAGRRMMPSVGEIGLAAILTDYVGMFLLLNALFCPAIYAG